MTEMEDSSWQTKFPTVRERVEYAFNNSLFCDIEFTVDDSNGDKVALSVNKFVLSVSSPVFETMFQGKLAEQGPQIHLPDCTKDGLQEMLRFLHSDVVNLTGSNVMEVLYLADKYMLPFLETRCYEYLANELTPGDVFRALTQAQQSHNSKAEELCWNVVDFQTHQAVTSKAFLNISRDLLRQVLERETLSIDEVNLFKAMDSWAESRIEDETKKEIGFEKRSVLGDEIVHLIRFPVMTQEEFADDVLVRDILRASEVTEVVQIFSSRAPSRTIFKRVKRSGQWNAIWTENRFDSMDTRYNIDSSETHNIVLEVNKPMFLAGVRLFAPDSDVQGTILLSIHKAKTNFELHSTMLNLEEETRTKIDDSYIGFTVPIKPPVFLLPMEKYSVIARLVDVKKKLFGFPFGSQNLFGSSSTGGFTFGGVSTPNVSRILSTVGSGGKSESSYQDLKITFIDPDDSANPGTTSKYGQFPSFLLKRKVQLKKRVVTTE